MKVVGIHNPHDDKNYFSLKFSYVSLLEMSNTNVNYLRINCTKSINQDSHSLNPIIVPL